MRRADRLFQIIQILRRSTQSVTAAALAEELEISKRTVYRDVADLIGQRVTVEVHVPQSNSVQLRLLGEIRHAAQDVRGSARIGIEFIGLSNVERSILDALELEHVG